MLRRSVFFCVLVLACLSILSVGSPFITAQGQVPRLDPTITKTRVTFKSGNLTLVGYLFKPDGDGPFPGIIWNHGSEQNPDKGQQFDAVANIFVPAGYVVFAPMRRGHGESEGPYIVDQLKEERQKNGADAASKLVVNLLEGPQLDDQLAGAAYLKSLPYVDTNRLGVIGCSYGGIQTLLIAEKNPGFKAAIAESPAAESWSNKYLQARLLKAVGNINIPVFLIHPERDASVGPGYTLGQEFQKLNKPYGLMIYPPFGPEDVQGHCFGGAKGAQLWAPNALWFFSNALG